MLGYFEFCFIFVQSLCRGNIDFFSKFCFPLCRVVQSAWELLVLLDFWKFSKSFELRKIWPGVCPILEILSLCLRLLKFLEIRKYSKCRFLGKIGQGSALHWCFRFLKFSKCGLLRKFDQGSAQFLKFWGFVCDFLKVFEISEISKCRFLGKIGQGSALH